jgi:hypothetical protein
MRRAIEQVYSYDGKAVVFFDSKIGDVTIEEDTSIIANKRDNERCNIFVSM